MPLGSMGSLSSVDARSPLPPTRYWFCLFQHGLAGTTHNFSLLKTVLASAIQEHNLIVLEQWKRGGSPSEGGLSPNRGPNQEIDLDSLPPLRLIDMTPFDTSVNSWFKSLVGTVSTGKRLYAELRKALMNWATEVATRVAVQHRTSLTSDFSNFDPDSLAFTTQLSPTGDTDITGVHGSYTEPFSREHTDSEFSQVTLIQDVFFSCVGHSFGGIILREVIAHVVEDTQLQALFEETGFSCDFFDGGGSITKTTTTNPEGARNVVSHVTPPVTPTMINYPKLPDRVVVKLRLQFASYTSIATPHCGVQRMSSVGKSIGSLMSLFGSYTHHELLLHDVKQDDILTLVKEALEDNPAKQKKDLSKSTNDNDEDRGKTKTSSVFSGDPLPPTTLPDSAPVLAGRLLQPHFLEALARFRSRTVYAAVNGDPFVTFQTGSFLFENFVNYLEDQQYDHFEDVSFACNPLENHHPGVRPYYGGRNQCRHRQGYVVRQTLLEAEHEARTYFDGKFEDSPAAAATPPARLAELKAQRRQRYAANAEDLMRLEEGYNISMRIKTRHHHHHPSSTSVDDEQIDNSSLSDVAVSDDDDEKSTPKDKKTRKAAVEKIEEILGMFNSSVRRPIHPSLYPSVLPGITVGGDATCKAYLKKLAFQYASNMAKLSMPGVTAAGKLAPVEIEDVVAATFLASLEIDVVPIRSDLFLHAAHKAVLGASRFGRPIGDVIEFVAKSLTADVVNF